MTDDDTDPPTDRDLEQRVEQLEQTVQQMLPSRRETLKLGGGALIGAGLMEATTGGAKAGSQSVGTIGTTSDPVDLVAEDFTDHNGNDVMELPGDGSVSIERGIIGPQLSHVGTLSDTALGRPHDVEIRRGVGVTAGKDGNVCRVDTYPRNGPSVSASNTSFTNAQSVAASPGRDPDFRWFIGGDSTVHSLITQPGTANSVDSVSLTNTRINGLSWYQTDPSLGSAYLFAAQKDGAVTAIDVTDTDALSVTNESTVTSATSPHDVALSGTRSITVDQADGSSVKLSVLNVASGSSTDVSASWSEDATFGDSRLNGANRIEMLNQEWAVVAANLANNLATVNIPAYDNSISIGDVVSDGANSGPSGLRVVGDYAIAASNDRVTIYDVTDPTNIVEVDQYVFGSAISGHDPAVDGRYLYVTGQSTDTVEIFDLGWEFARDAYAERLTTGAA